MRIAVFSDSINIPPKEGINVHTYELLCEFARRENVEPILFVCDRGWLNNDVLKALPFDTILIPENQFYEQSIIATLLSEYAIDIVQSYMTYFSSEVLGPAAATAEVPMVAEFHDLEESIIPLYFDEADVPSATRTHREFQRNAAKYASLVRTVSSYDLDIIKDTWSEYSPNKYFWMPVSRALGPVPQTTIRDRVLYIGNMSYRPNQEGAEILRDIAPAIALPEGITFVGRGSQEYSTKFVNALGMIDDIDDIVAHTAIGLSPIISGSGIKIKNLTYLSNGIPCLSTHFGANSFPPSEAILLEDDFSKWPAIIQKLLNDTDERERLSKIAREYFKTNFDIVSNTDILLDKYQSVIDAYPSTLIAATAPVKASVDLEHVYWLRERREPSTSIVTAPTHIKSAQKAHK